MEINYKMIVTVFKMVSHFISAKHAYISYKVKKYIIPYNYIIWVDNENAYKRNGLVH